MSEKQQDKPSELAKNLAFTIIRRSVLRADNLGLVLSNTDMEYIYNAIINHWTMTQDIDAPTVSDVMERYELPA